MDELGQYWLILKRRWLPASLVFAVILVSVAAYTFTQKPIYQSKGQVLIKKTNKTSALISDATAFGQLESLSGSNPLSTQAEIIKSRPIVEAAVKSLGFDDDPDKVSKNIKITPIKQTDIMEISYQDGDTEKAQKIVQKLMEIFASQDTDKQRKDALQALQFINQEVVKAQPKLLEIEQRFRLFKEKNQVVDLPTESAKVVDIVTNLNKDITTIYGQYQSEANRAADLQKLFGENAQTAIQSGIVSETPGLQKSISELQEVEQKLAVERTRLTDQNPIVQDLSIKKQALTQIVRQRIQQTLVGRPNFKGKVLELSKSGIQESLISEFAKSEAQKISLQKQVEALVTVRDAYYRRMNIIPQLEQQQRQLARELEVQQETYRGFLKKQQELQVAVQQQSGNVDILTPAILPDDPVSPKKAQNMAIGALLALMGGAATAFVLDSTDKRIKDAEEAKRLLPDYPVVGNIPAFLGNEQEYKPLLNMGKKQRRTPGQLVMLGEGDRKKRGYGYYGYGGGKEVESFRSLQTNLRFLNADNSLKVIVISSAIPGEGKSTVSANLAIATAQLGKKVLLVDGDMRRPSQHQIWKKDNDNGLSTVLTGQSDFDTSVIEVYPRTELLEPGQEIRGKVDFLPSGKIPPNPVLLIDSTEMGRQIGNWSNNYDFVIIDAPPVTVAADAKLLGKLVGGLLFVVRPNKADRDSLLDATEILQQSQQNVLGVVLNGVKVEKSKYYSDYYYNRNHETATLPSATNDEAEIAKLPPSTSQPSFRINRDQ